MGSRLGPVTVDEVPTEVTCPLRRGVLRPDGGDLAWVGDEDVTTIHLAARSEAGDVVGVARFHPAARPWRPHARAPWRLRGMATDPALRGSGAGRALSTVGDVFDKPGIGPHVGMVIDVDPSAATRSS